MARVYLDYLFRFLDSKDVVRLPSSGRCRACHEISGGCSLPDQHDGDHVNSHDGATWIAYELCGIRLDDTGFYCQKPRYHIRDHASTNGDNRIQWSRDYDSILEPPQCAATCDGRRCQYPAGHTERQMDHGCLDEQGAMVWGDCLSDALQPSVDMGNEDPPPLGLQPLHSLTEEFVSGLLFDLDICELATCAERVSYETVRQLLWRKTKRDLGPTPQWEKWRAQRDAAREAEAPKRAVAPLPGDIFEHFAKVFAEYFGPQEKHANALAFECPAWANPEAWRAAVFAFLECRQLRAVSRNEVATIRDSISDIYQRASRSLSASDWRKLLDGIAAGETIDIVTGNRGLSEYDHAIAKALLAYTRVLYPAPRPEPFRRKRDGLPVDND